MINFFRKKNSPQNYFLYALGEITLVIVGILIALYINNWNEDRQQVAKVETIFRSVLKDLETDILNCKKSFTVLNDKDSLIQLVINDSLTIEDYRKNDKLQKLIFSNRTMDFSNNGYENLVQNLDYIPPTLEHILPGLDILYKDHQNDLVEAIDNVHRFVKRTIEKWTDHQDWFSNYINGLDDKEYLNYFLKNPKYKNEISLYKMYLGDNLKKHTLHYQYQAILSYMEIAKALDQPIPDFVTSYMIDLPIATLEKYEGTYRYDPEQPGYKIVLKGKGLEIYPVGNSSGVLFLPRSEKEFFNYLSVRELLFKIEPNGRIDTFNYKWETGNVDFARVNLDSMVIEQVDTLQ